MSQPVYLPDVTRVTWDLVELPAYKHAVAKEITSGAAFTGRGASSDGIGAVQDAIAPQLRVVSSPDVFNSRIGVDAPVLEWVDKSPELTASWTVYRVANPEGAGSGASTTWTAVMRLGAEATTFRDVSLPDGYSAQYIVVATLKDGRDGPSSNQVATGLRPAVPAITATGRQSAIALSWTRTDGADSWDLYRDGALYKSWSSMKAAATVGASTVAWTDPTGTGHAHEYAVVAINRWERAATVTTAQGVRDPGAQANQLEVGTDSAAAFGAPGLTATRLVSTASGAWSAPLAPTAVTAANRQPADIDNPDSTWETVVDVTWTASAWTGGYSAAAAEATRYALVRGSTTVRTGVQDTKASDDGNAPRGATSTYKVTASTLAPHPLTGGTGTTSLLTWPAAPSCTATPGGGGQPATRAATVSVAAPGGQAVTGLRQRIRSGEIRATSTDAWTTLAHSTTHYWRGQASNTGGYGPWSPECSTTTDVLAVRISGASWTTRSVVADADATNGTSRSIGVDEKGYSVPGTHLEYDQLEDGQPWTVTASNTDGFNTVTDRRSGSAGVPNSTNDPGFRTPPLVAPTPTCAATVTDSQAPGAITVGGGDQVKLGSGGTVYAGPRSYSGLAAGTYVGYARNVISDGHNSATSGWDACPGRSVVNPPPVTRGAVWVVSMRRSAPAMRTTRWCASAWRPQPLLPARRSGAGPATSPPLTCGAMPTSGRTCPGPPQPRTCPARSRAGTRCWTQAGTCSVTSGVRRSGP